MKKTYNKPMSKCIMMDGADAILMTLSGENGLDGTSFGGDTSTENILNADIKEISGKNLWDSEW